MPNNVNTLVGGNAPITIENDTFKNTVLLKRMLPELFFARFGQKKGIPENSGDSIEFRKFNALAPAITPLTEGVTPSGNSLIVTNVTAQLGEYGDYITVTDKLKKQSIDQVETESAEVLGEQGGQTIDLVVRDIICGGTSKRYAGNRANTASITANDKISAAEIKKCVRDLKNSNTKPLLDGYYVGIVDPTVESDLMDDELWQDVSKYNGGINIQKGEIGKLHGVRFFTTSQLKVKEGGPTSYFATEDSAVVAGKKYYTRSGDAGSYVYTLVASPATANIATYYEANYRPVHCVMIIGKDAYGVVDFDNSARGKKPKIISKGLGSAGADDPLNQRATVGWKAEFTAVRLEELAMVRLECAATED